MKVNDNNKTQNKGVNEMLVFKNSKGEKIIEVPEEIFPIYIVNSKNNKAYKLLITGQKKLILN